MKTDFKHAKPVKSHNNIYCEAGFDKDDNSELDQQKK
jgi:hypothetical protein